MWRNWSDFVQFEASHITMTIIIRWHYPKIILKYVKISFLRNFYCIFRNFRWNGRRFILWMLALIPKMKWNKQHRDEVLQKFLMKKLIINTKNICWFAVVQPIRMLIKSHENLSSSLLSGSFEAWQLTLQAFYKQNNMWYPLHATIFCKNLNLIWKVIAR